MSSTPNKQNPPFQCNVPVIMMQWFTFTCNRVLYSVVLVLILKQKIQYFLHFCSELNASRSDSSSALTTQSDNDLLILLSERQRIMKPVSPTVCQMFCWLDVRLSKDTKRNVLINNWTPHVSPTWARTCHKTLIQTLFRSIYPQRFVSRLASPITTITRVWRQRCTRSHALHI